VGLAGGSGRAQTKATLPDDQTLRRLRAFLGVQFLGAGALHFTHHHAFEQVVPESVAPYRRELSLTTGMLQIVAGVSFFVPRLRTVARWAALAVVLPSFPAAFNQVRHPEPVVQTMRIPPALVPLRIPLQALVAGLVWWATRSPQMAVHDGSIAAISQDETREEDTLHVPDSRIPSRSSSAARTGTGA
jgi:uncharacterized membrane protein